MCALLTAQPSKKIQFNTTVVLYYYHAIYQGLILVA